MKDSIVFFDGTCSLCSGFVNFIFRFDKKKKVYVASLQGKTAKSLLPIKYIENYSTVVFVTNGKIYDQSSAVLRVLSLFSFPWSLLSIFIFLPEPIRDFLYILISKNRYRIFGRRDSCRVATVKERDRFLD